jgi:opacity protein-like surface antigen
MNKRVITIMALALAALALPAATASAADRDHDRMRDSWEKHYKLNTHKNDARKDRDRDGLRNIDEFRAGTSPRQKDSDDDGIRDDDEGAGTIKSFDQSTGVLVIDVFDSDTDLTGKVDATTKIECDDEGDDDDKVETRRRDGADDNSGPGNAEDRGDGEHGDREDGDSGDGEHGDRDDDAQQPGCDASALTVGRTVKEAELNEGDDGPADVFHEIELAR